MKQIFVFLIAISIFSCGKDDDLKPVEPKYDLTKAIADLNVAYGSDKANVMDVYLPANRSVSTTKVLILLHGGAWTDLSGGDKNDEQFAPIVDSIRRRLPEWAIFNLNYRLATLSGNNKFPAQEEDISKAVKFISDNRPLYGISDKWVLGGASAGAHLAMLQSYKNGAPIRPKAVVNFFGPVDLVGLYNYYGSEGDVLTQSGMRTLLGGSPSTAAQMYANSSPINFINAQSPPTIILHGGNDDVVPVAQSAQLRDKLIAAGVRYEYADYLREQTHGWSDPAIWTKSLNSIQNFLTANVP